MKYRWKPSASQKRAFAERMKDLEEQRMYEEKKRAKNTYSGDPRSFKHKSFVPTENQYKVSWKMLNDDRCTKEQENSCNMIIYGYICQEKVHHDHIHIVNELTRNKEEIV